MRTSALILAATLAVAVPAAGQVSDLFPLPQGATWTYHNEFDETLFAMINGEATVLGRPCRRRLVAITFPVPQSFENYWTVDAFGNVYLHGFRDLASGAERAYQPPVLWLPGDLHAGSQWSTPCAVFHALDGSILGWPLTFAYFCADVQDVVTPSGTYPAYAVRQSLGDWDAAGQIDAAERDAVWWYSDDAGLVRYDTGGSRPYLLTVYSGPITGVLPADEPVVTTWGAVKALFDDNRRFTAPAK